MLRRAFAALWPRSVAAAAASSPAEVPVSGAMSSSAAAVDLTGSDAEGDATAARRKRARPASHAATSETERSGRIRIVTYNVDGLESRHMVERARGVVAELESLRPPPDVVALQEIVADNESEFRKYAARHGFHVFSGSKVYPEYYAVLLVSSRTFQDVTWEAEAFPDSFMGRHVIRARGLLHGATLVSLWTSHLESLRPGGPERKRQLSKVLRDVAAAREHSYCFFMGDMNLRDEEVVEVGGLPTGVVDAWEAAGAPSDTKWTWDLSLNDNKTMPGGGTPRCRFDRMYCGGPGGGLKPTQFKLIGLARLPAPVGMFPSDHFGMLVDFELS